MYSGGAATDITLVAWISSRSLMGHQRNSQNLDLAHECDHILAVERIHICEGTRRGPDPIQILPGWRGKSALYGVMRAPNKIRYHLDVSSIPD